MTDRVPFAGAGALVLFSGGQDSAVCLAWALDRYPHIETIGFHYGQRHGVEMEVRKRFLAALPSAFPAWGSRLGQDHELELPELGRISETALTRDAEITFAAGGLPSTFVPGRNLLLFIYSAALAYRRGIRTLVGGMCETDFSGYPDCRDETLRSLERSISLGMASDFAVETPLMFVDKAQTWAIAQALGGQPLIDLIIEETHTCYLGIRSRRHVWGYGCGHCPACDLRRKGWDRWTDQAASVTP